MASTTPTPESPIEAYIEAARRRLVSLDGAGETTWRKVVEQGLGDAYAERDFGGLARVVQFLVNLLESQARFGDARAEIDLAMDLMHGAPGPRASLQALKAALICPRGELEEALDLANSASAAALEHLAGDAKAKALALVETVRMVALEQPTPSMERLYGELLREQRPLDHLFVLSWEISCRATRSEPEAVRPLIRSFRAIARRRRAGFREAEIPVYERWLAIATGTAMPFDEGQSTHTHPFAHWRMACLDFWQGIAQRNWAQAEFALQAMDRRRLRPGSDTGPIEPWQALLRAANGEGLGGHLAPPPLNRLVANNLASGVAGAYAIALAGSRESAAEWLEWVGKVRRRGIESSLELPVSLRRVQGLLALRSGKQTHARKLLDLAARPAGDAGRGPEAALGALQSEELRAKIRPGAAGQALLEARRAVVELGIDPVPHMYVIHQAWDVGIAQTDQPPLTPREMEVLRELSLGHTYKQTAEALGIAWPTVQTFSHRVYEKLSVSNRVEAIAEGRRLGLL